MRFEARQTETHHRSPSPSSHMRLISWNCNGALRNKLHKVLPLDADICVIQECEDPAQSTSDDYKTWAGNYLWTGTNKNRGLGVFAKPNIALTAVPLDTEPLELFLPCTIDQSLSLLAVWTRDARSPTFRYIGQLWKFLQKHPRFLASDRAILLGDLNSNARWDVWDRWWNHSDVVRQLNDMGLISLFHHANNEQQGQESVPTFFMHRNTDKPYHIDYAFLSRQLLQGATCEIGHPSDWLSHSDHMPLMVEI